MAEEKKRLYWLKLKKDFFKRHDVRIIKSMENGKDYIIFYLELLCESLDHQGELRFNEDIPYNETMLATITDTNVDIVRSAIRLFQELGLVEIWDNGTYYMTKVQEMIGSYADTEGAERVRRFRENKKAEALQERYNGVTKCNEISDIRYKISDTKKEEFVSTDTHSSKESVCVPAEKSAAYEGINAHNIAPVFKDKFNNIDGVIRCEKITVKREIAVSTILSHFTKEEIGKVFEKLSNSTFLKGDNDKGWKVSFDWLFDIDNFTTVLEGKYDQRKTNSKNPEKTESTDRSEWTDADEEMKRREEEFVAKWRAKHESDK